jgi:hypothetical protein
MPTAERQKLLDRLAAVETLAERGATAGEREAARSRAQRLRDRHGITDSELHGTPKVAYRTPRTESQSSFFYDLMRDFYGPDGFYSSFAREPVSNEVRLTCTCGHVTTRIVLSQLTSIIAYRCTGCQSQRRFSNGDFSRSR